MAVKKRKPSKSDPAAVKQLNETILRSIKDRRMNIKRTTPGKGKIIEQRVHRIDKSTGKSFAEFGRKKRRTA